MAYFDEYSKRKNRLLWRKEGESFPATDSQGITHLLMINIKKISLILVLFSVISLFTFTACGAKKEETQAPAETEAPIDISEIPKAGEFKFEHDPRENPEAMIDIIENPEAIYGFSPNPESNRLGTYAELDWTNPEIVATLRQQRREYHKMLNDMEQLLQSLRDEGKSDEEIATVICAERNRIRMKASENSPVDYVKMRTSNMLEYGNYDGPTAEWLYEKYGSWEEVIQRAFQPNFGMDVCCGLYDEIYPLYQKVGLME